MAMILGMDTGGTYTDSVLVDPAARRVLRQAKAFTTRQDLLCGMEESLTRLGLDAPDALALVCLSTTLATNAVVEGQGGRVGALLLGYDTSKPLPATHVRRIPGKLDIKGRVVEDISEAETAEAVAAWAGQVDAVAISGFASVRNPVQEKRVQAIVRRVLDVPVVCGHELSSALGLHERTVTAILNAALIPSICELLDAAERLLDRHRIRAPLMLVKGDGSLMHAALAREKPIETVLSGPAASIVGGLFLAGQTDALVVDMGGTTSDFAQLTRGKTVLCAQGAQIGGWHTQLRAAEIATFGIGGDSGFRLQADGTLAVGPQRVLPLCVAGHYRPALAEELRTTPIPDHYTVLEEQPFGCYRFLRPPRHRDLTAHEQKLCNLLSDGPHTLFYLAERMQTDPEQLGLSALVRAGVLQRCGLTPTDLLHIRGGMARWDTAAARAGGQILADHLGLSLEDCTEQAIAAVHTRLRECCIQAAASFAGAPLDLADPAVQLFLGGDCGAVHTQIGLNRPVVALGAPARAWLPAVCRKLGTQAIIPAHAEVASAVGAAVGQVMATAEALVRPDRYHTGYLVHTSWESPWFARRDTAEDWAKRTAQEQARLLAERAGGGACTVQCTVQPTQSHFAGETQFIQTKITATAVASPQWAEKE